MSYEGSALRTLSFQAFSPILGPVYCSGGSFTSARKASRLNISPLLIALTSAKRVSELHVPSVHHSCPQFALGLPKVALLPNPAFMPKVSSNYKSSWLFTLRPSLLRKKSVSTVYLQCMLCTSTWIERKHDEITLRALGSSFVNGYPIG